MPHFKSSSFSLSILQAILAFAFAFAAMLVAGCDRGPTLYPVTGKVLFQNQPADGASIVFIQADKTKNASGKVQPDGSFSLETFPHGAGAFPGDYQVTVTWLPENARELDNPVNKLPAKFSDPNTSGLTATVKEGTNELPPFELSK